MDNHCSEHHYQSYLPALFSIIITNPTYSCLCSFLINKHSVDPTIIFFWKFFSCLFVLFFDVYIHLNVSIKFLSNYFILMMNNNNERETQLLTSKFFSPPSMTSLIPTSSLTLFTSFATIRPWLQWLWPNC